MQLSESQIASYEQMMGTPQDPSEHEAASMPPASDDRWGQDLGQVPTAPKDIQAIRQGRDDVTEEDKQKLQGKYNTNKGETKTKGNPGKKDKGKK